MFEELRIIPSLLCWLILCQFDWVSGSLEEALFSGGSVRVFPDEIRT